MQTLCEPLLNMPDTHKFETTYLFLIANWQARSQGLEMLHLPFNNFSEKPSISKDLTSSQDML